MMFQRNLETLLNKCYYVEQILQRDLPFLGGFCIWIIYNWSLITSEKSWVTWLILVASRSSELFFFFSFFFKKGSNTYYLMIAVEVGVRKDDDTFNPNNVTSG